MFETIIDAINTFLYSKLLIVILIGSGIYFTVRTRFPQVRLFKNACSAVMEKPEGDESVSSFQALMVSTASRVGTGNIVGVSSPSVSVVWAPYSGCGSLPFLEAHQLWQRAHWRRYIRKKEKTASATAARRIT